MDYGHILGRAWRITWDHRALWLFGLLTGLSFQFRLNVSNLPPSTQQWLRDISSHPAFVPVVIGLVVFSFLVGLLLSILNALGRAALVDQVDRIEEGIPATIGSGWEAGKRYVWRVFVISFLLGLPAVVIILAGLLPLVIPVLQNVETLNGAWPDIQGVFFACFLPACCVGVVLGIVLGTIGQLAERTCVLEDQPVWRSIGSGWELLRNNLGPVGVLWLVLAGVRLGVGIVLGIPTCVLAAALVVPMVFLMQESPPVGLAGLCGIGILLWLVGMAVNSVVETFFSSCWTLGYRDLRGPKEIEFVAEEAAQA
jgi:hypothetical protein